MSDFTEGLVEKVRLFLNKTKAERNNYARGATDTFGYTEVQEWPSRLEAESIVRSVIPDEMAKRAGELFRKTLIDAYTLEDGTKAFPDDEWDSEIETFERVFREELRGL